VIREPTSLERAGIIEPTPLERAAWALVEHAQGNARLLLELSQARRDALGQPIGSEALSVELLAAATRVPLDRVRLGLEEMARGGLVRPSGPGWKLVKVSDHA